MSKNKIAVVIPTYNRPKLRKRCLLSIAVNVSVPVTAVVVDNSDERYRTSNDEIQKLLADSPHTGIRVELPPACGVGMARDEGVGTSLWAGCDHVVNIDDDTIVGKGAIETLVSIQQQEPLFGQVGAAGTLDRIGRKQGEVWFQAGSAGCLCHSRQFLEQAGSFDPDFDIREDGEISFRVWDEGFYVGTALVDVVNKRHQPYLTADGRQATKQHHKMGSPEWMEACHEIARRYPDLVWVTSDGKIRRKFKFPNVKYSLRNGILTKECVSDVA